MLSKSFCDVFKRLWLRLWVYFIGDGFERLIVLVCIVLVLLWMWVWVELIIGDGVDGRRMGFCVIEIVCFWRWFGFLRNKVSFGEGVGIILILCILNIVWSCWYWCVCKVEISLV